MNSNKIKICDVLIIGSGAAGLTMALSLKDKNIILATKNTINEGATIYAQGGIAAVLHEKDSIESHTKDTFIAGAELGELEVIKKTVTDAKDALSWLINQGVEFNKVKVKGKEEYHLHQEGGHSNRRILHKDDQTGREIQKSLQKQVSETDNISTLEQHQAIDLINVNNKVLGAYFLDKNNDEIIQVRSKITIMATGGASEVYKNTSSDSLSKGDGIAMAWRAGCKIANMEFNQFHPTSLYSKTKRKFLISEALRGEGAILLDHNNHRFMEKYDNRLELAPRDIISRAIVSEMQSSNKDFMFLDISHQPNEKIKKMFPCIYKICQEECIDITKESIPITPAAHYTCGGIMVDYNSKTDLENLYAVGEVSYTGLHGANRMASNSLLECIVFARNASKKILEELNCFLPTTSNIVDLHYNKNHKDDLFAESRINKIKNIMWENLGVIRSNNKINTAIENINKIRAEIKQLSKDQLAANIDLINTADIARMITLSAQIRKESRGIHYNIDHPNMDEKFKNPTVIINKK